MSDLHLNKIKKFYNNRYDKFGNKLESIGWSNRKDQKLRFEKLLNSIDISNKTILDAGCGFGDLYVYIKKNYNFKFNYVGIEITEKILQIAKNRLKYKNAKFDVCDLLSYKNDAIDISILSGSLTLKFKNSNSYTNKVLKKIYEISKISCSINFMSSYSDYQLPKNDHYQPEKIFKIAKKISNKVNIIHDYPLYEFTLQMFK